MAFSAIAAIAAAASAASGIYGAVQGSANSAAAGKSAAQTSSNNLQNSLNQQQYQKALNTIAMNRSVAGSTDSRGDTLTYDPGTNTWKTALSPTGQRVQSAADSAAVGRNTTDVRTAQDANTQAMLSALSARGAAGTALNKLNAYKPMSEGGLEGALQETATTANRQAEDPVIADTLRQFARTGTAAGPVLTNMMRDNATSLRQTMLNDQINAMKNVGSINATNQGSLASTYDTLNKAANPTLNYANINTTGPNDALLSEMTSRASSAPQSASTGAYSNSASTNATNAASDSAVKGTYQNNSGATTTALGDSLKSLTNSNGDFMSYIKSLTDSGSGNAGDLPTSKTGASNNFGDTSNGVYSNQVY